MFDIEQLKTERTEQKYLMRFLIITENLKIQSELI